MPEPSNANALIGCDFDAATAKALNGKNIVAVVTSKDGKKLLAVAGQTGLTYSISSETSESKTKDDANGGWSLKFHGSKSWDASIDGLYSPDDEALKLIAKAIDNDEYLCLKIVERTKTPTGVKYVPLRMGRVIITSDKLEAPSDDNATYSLDFEGVGKPWMRETAKPEEIEAATWTVSA